MKKVIVFSIILCSNFIGKAQNVGIGTVSPQYKLHVDQGSLFIQSSAGDLQLGYYGSNKWHFATTNGGADLLMQSDVNASPTPRVYFQQSGNVGIGNFGGANVPTTTLHLKSNSNNPFIIDGLAPMYSSIVEGGVYRGYWGSYAGAPADVDFGTGGNNNGGSLHLTIQASPKLSIDSTGRIGMGTMFPQAPVHIKGTTSEMLRIGGAAPFISLYDNTDGYKCYWWYNGTDEVMGSFGTSAIRFAPGNFYSANFNSDGRVSIGPNGGTAATGYLLSVKGKVICEEAKIQLSASWPDYVFSNTYKLMPLKELEKSIQKEQHLPNIPSAVDVEKNGILVGDMSKRIMEKVEELTLYIIDLNKKNEQLQKEVDELKKQVKKN